MAPVHGAEPINLVFHRNAFAMVECPCGQRFHGWDMARVNYRFCQHAARCKVAQARHVALSAEQQGNILKMAPKAPWPSDTATRPLC